MNYAKWGLFVAALAATAASAQSAPYLATSSSAATLAASASEDQQPLLTIKKRVDEVNLLFIATDKHGRFVRNLGQADFNILDDHQPPQSILNFRRETDLPLLVGLMVDVSGSIRSRFTFEQESAVAFLQRTLRPGFDQAFVIGFNGHTQLMQDFTDNLGALSAGIHHMRAGGGTALYDAIYHACRDKLLQTKTDHPVRRALIILSDGEDNQSEVSREAAIEMAQRAEVILYTISTDDSSTMQRGDHMLTQLAEATGGRAFFPLKAKDVTHSFDSIEDELRSQYVVSYKPAAFDADGRYRSIEISTLKKDLHVRARKGYFAPRQ
jgi:Ca-activated chloride channel family protein